MFATIRYFKHRKDVSFTILKTFNSFINARMYALECAQSDFGIENVVVGVYEKFVWRFEPRSRNLMLIGYDDFVYTVIEIEEPEDEKDEIENEKDEKKNGKEDTEDDTEDDTEIESETETKDEECSHDGSVCLWHG